MANGDYIVLIEESTDVGRKVWMSTERGHQPQEGNELRVEGVLYRVNKVRHDEDPQNFSSRNATIPIVYVRDPLPGQKLPTSGRGGLAKPPRKAKVLEFVPPPQSRPVSSFLLPPSLIAWIVGHAYARQEDEYGRAREPSYLVEDRPGQWLEFKITNPRELSNRASRALADLAVFVDERLKERVPTEFVDGCYTNALAPETARANDTLDDGEARTKDDRPPGKPLPRRAQAPQPEAPTLEEPTHEEAVSAPQPAMGGLRLVKS